MAYGPWGNEVEASSRFSGTWITDPDDPSRTVIRLRYGGVGRQNSKDRAKTALQFVGRKYPVYDVGDARAESISVDAVLSSEDGDAEEQMELLERLIGDGEVILFRDGRGRKMYAMGTDFQAEDLDMGSYKVNFLLNRVDFDEALPEPEAAPPIEIDIQPKNFVVTADQTTRMAFLEWDDVPGTTLYHIILNGVEVGSTSESASTYGPLAPGEYTFNVTATVGGKTGPPSNPQSIAINDLPTGPPPNNVPLNFRAFPTAQNTVAFNWDGVPGATKYRVEENRSPNGVTNGETTSTSMTRGPLGDGPFNYWVRAFVNGAWSDKSNTQAFTLPFAGGGSGGGGGGGALPSPTEVLGIKNGDAGYLHYNLGHGFKTGHKDYSPQELEDWSATTKNELAAYYYTVIDAAGKYAVAQTVDPDGARTSSGTSYPRDEHREMEQTDTNNANKASWNPQTGDHDFSGFSRIMTLPPAKPGVCINQTHDTKDVGGGTGDDTVMIKSMSLSGKIAIVLDVMGTRVKVLNADYKLGIEIWSRIRVNNNTLTVYYSESASTTTSATPSTTVAHTVSNLTTVTSGWYHKFGAYAQSNDTTDTSGTKVLVQTRDWKQWHTGWPAPVTGNYAGPGGGGGGTGLPVVNAGADATVQPGDVFSRTAIISGAGVTAQGWRVVGSSTVITASPSLNYTTPTTAQTVNLEFFATNATGTSTDNIVLTVGAPDGGGEGGGGGGVQTIGVNGVARPAPAAHVVLESGPTVGTKTISTSGTASLWRIYDGGGFDCGKMRITAQYVIVQNYRINGDDPHAVEIDGGNVIFQNNDIRNVHGPGDINAITAWGNNIKWLYNTSVNFITGDPGTSHSDWLQTWVSTSHPVPSSDWEIGWNRVTGPANPGRSASTPSIHQIIMAEDYGLGGNTGGQQTGMKRWYIHDNEFSASWNQDIKLDGVDDVDITRNKFTGSSDRVIDPQSSVGVRFWSDNIVGNGYGQTGMAITPGAGPGSGGGGGGGGGGGTVYPEQYPDGSPLATYGAAQTVVNVSGSAALTSALANAQPGQIITLASGSYSGQFTIAKVATASQGIIIRSATRLGAVFASGSTFKINNAAYVTVDGLDFPNDIEGDTLTIRGSSHHVQFRRCRVGPATFTNKTTVGNYIYVGDDVHHFRIGYNTLRNKGTSGNVIRVYGNFTSFVGCQYGVIDHNLIDTLGDEVGNDKEGIRYGVSTMSRTVANALIFRNVLTNLKAEPECISGKMASVYMIGNVLLKCAGGIVIRHGRNCKQLSNYIVDRVNTTATAGLKSGGTRFYDSGHEIANNYYDGLAGTSGFQKPLMVDTGDAGGSSTNLSAHWNVVDGNVHDNVIRNCPSGINIGDNYSTAPANTAVINNDVINSGGSALTTVTPMTGDSPTTGNTHYASDSAGGYTVGADGIARKAGKGPKVRYLTTADVGVNGDIDELDKMGAAL